MKNSIDAHIEFSFKGETYTVVSNIDLNQHESLKIARIQAYQLGKHI